MTLDELTLDFPAFMEKRRSVMEQFAGIAAADLPALTTEVYARLQPLVAGDDDALATFVPEDPAATDGPGWTLGHVIVHLTAGLEEQAAQGSTLARGAEITGRPRYETPWESVTTMDQIRQRVAESRRQTLAFLETWPDAPHLDNLHEHSFFGPLNAVAYHLLGVNHAKGHLAQLAEIRRQAASGVPTT